MSVNAVRGPADPRELIRTAQPLAPSCGSAVEDKARPESGPGPTIAAMRTVGTRGRRTPIPPAARQAVVAHANAARAEGKSWREIARVVGLSAGDPHNWRKRRLRGPLRAGGGRALLAPVLVRGEVPMSSVTLALVAPSGHRIDGLDISSAAELLRRLA